MKRLGIVSGLAFWLMVIGAPHGSAGGSVWHFDDAEYRPGDIAEATTSVSWSHNGSLGTPEDGPFVIYLAPVDAVAESWPGLPDGAVPVGIVEIHLGPYLESDGQWYGQHHAVARFEIPDVSPGEYQIAHCNSPCTKALGDIIGGWDLHVIAGPNGRPAAEIADEVWLAVEEYPQWTEPETPAPSEDAIDPDLDMLSPPSRAFASVEPSSVESPSDPVSVPDSREFAVSSEPVDSESSTGAIAFLATALAVLMALLLIPLVDRIGWFTNRILRNPGRTTFEAMADKETTSEAVQKDEAVAQRP